MNRERITLVRTSFERAERLGPHVAATFYAELFAIAPELRPMFRGDIILQGTKLMSMLSQLVAALDSPDTLAPMARELAVRHVAYGVEARHYALVGTALMRTLRHELGRDFTPDVSAAWMEAYDILADTMKEAAYGPAAQPQL